jgi:outer membrane protein assembly factor BamB
VTKYTGTLTTDQVDAIYWDNSNHLYAISKATNKLRIYIVTPTSYSEPKGSPYTVTAPSELMVQTLPNS